MFVNKNLCNLCELACFIVEIDKRSNTFHSKGIALQPYTVLQSHSNLTNSWNARF